MLSRGSCSPIRAPAVRVATAARAIAASLRRSPVPCPRQVSAPNGRDHAVDQSDIAWMEQSFEKIPLAKPLEVAGKHEECATSSAYDHIKEPRPWPRIVRPESKLQESAPLAQGVEHRTTARKKTRENLYQSLLRFSCAPGFVAHAEVLPGPDLKAQVIRRARIPCGSTSSRQRAATPRSASHGRQSCHSAIWRRITSPSTSVSARHDVPSDSAMSPRTASSPLRSSNRQLLHLSAANSRRLMAAPDLVSQSTAVSDLRRRPRCKTQMPRQRLSQSRAPCASRGRHVVQSPRPSMFR